ncbi:hypothetical protein BaRGS_00016140 [Batillaria attramentaria]|uniref:Uncharacterized protein n=1 Tax=Batillaria attramentaria TaxID=370345 RepID=A0ABD0KZY7_9CAEN
MSTRDLETLFVVSLRSPAAFSDPDHRRGPRHHQTKTDAVCCLTITAKRLQLTAALAETIIMRQSPPRKPVSVVDRNFRNGTQMKSVNCVCGLDTVSVGQV